jgi:tRNA dimethylallyltransferase
VIIIAGPTASGKSALAINIARRLAEQGKTAEIISVDSAQVYRHMDIGTAKPTEAELREFAHHGINLIDPTESYSAGRFREDCLATVHAIHARDHVPLLVGGTMMYFNVLWRGIHDYPSAPEPVRQAIAREASLMGWQALHQRLFALDADYAKNIAPTDRQRISRGLEILAEGRKPSEAQNQRAIQATDPSPCIEAFPHSFLAVLLMPEDRTMLRLRIRKRWMSMWENGLWAEFVRLQNRYLLTPDLPSMRCVGYRQLWQYSNAINHDNTTIQPDRDGVRIEADLHEKAVIATAQLAKRQMTWLRSFLHSPPHPQPTLTLDPTTNPLDVLTERVWQDYQPIGMR